MHIGQSRCTRCGGGSLACPVCNPLPETITNMNITSTDVSEWMLEELATAHESEEYAQLTVTINAMRGQRGKTPIFTVYHSSYKQSGDCGSFGEAFAKIRALRPLNQAQAKRAQAAALIAAAEELEALA